MGESEHGGFLATQQQGKQLGERQGMRYLEPERPGLERGARPCDRAKAMRSHRGDMSAAIPTLGCHCRVRRDSLEAADTVP